MTELLPLKAKRRIWSLRRRGTPFSSIFRRATKDGAPGGRKYANLVCKIEKPPAPSSRIFVPFNPHHYFANFWFKNPVSYN